MDIIRFKGGLGNQMFQYAFLKALSSQGRKVAGSLGFYANHPGKVKFCLDEVFADISLEIVKEEVFEEIDAKWKVIKQDKERLEKFLLDYENCFFWVERKDGTYDEHVFETSNCVFTGYWQSEKYFSGIKQEILTDFQFSVREKDLRELKNEICSGKCYVSVHCRRGDYLQIPELYGGICSENYYKVAMDYFRREIGHPLFVFFSDDISWVKEHFNYPDAIYVEKDMFKNYQDWYDMCLMSCCTHNIIANSSFSWWGAWLNRNSEKKVIAPKRWLNNSETPDIWCDNWILI